MNPIVLTFGGKRLVNSSGKALFRYGTTVIRGRTYKTVRIGNQEWLAENFQYDDGGNYIYTIPSGMYHASELIFNSVSARRVAALAGEGWRLPSYSDFETMCTATGVTLLTSGTYQDQARTYEVLLGLSDWPYEDSKDSYGFNLLPIPFSSDGGYSFVDQRTTSNLLTSSNDNNTSMPYRVYINNGIIPETQYHGIYIIADSDIIGSIRLVRDIQ